MKNYSSLLIILTASFLWGCQGTFKKPDTPKETKQAEHTQQLLDALPTPNVALEETPLDTPPFEDPPLPIAPPEFWSELRNGFLLDLTIENKRLATQRNWYLKHPRYIDRVIERGKPYLFYIFQEAQKRNLPLELVLLPIVESAFDPFAYSHGRASGLWQFIPGTGKMFGLKQTWWYDGRRDIVAATDAALSYLEALNKQFKGNWLHALAAYNAGAGNVRKGIRYNKKRGLPTDFWSLRLPKETKAYVPKLLALAQIFKEPEKYGITLDNIPYESQFAKIDVGSQIDLSQAANLADISLNELYRFNPGFNRWATDPAGPHYLLIPTAKAEKFSQGIAQLPPEKRVQWALYKIKPGDSLIRIAKKNRTTVKVIKDVNGIKSHQIVAGKTLLIPKASKSSQHYTLSLDQRVRKKQNKQRQGRHKTLYTVKSGDSFWTIGRKYKVGVRSLAKWNGMAPTDTLRKGQKLTIWTPVKKSSGNSQIRKIKYKARNGDSYAKIAQKFNVTLAQLKRWNHIDVSKYLQPGDRLTLYVDVRHAP